MTPSDSGNHPFPKTPSDSMTAIDAQRGQQRCPLRETTKLTSTADLGREVVAGYAKYAVWNEGVRYNADRQIPTPFKTKGDL